MANNFVTTVLVLIFNIQGNSWPSDYASSAEAKPWWSEI